ncbi:hypothetical protein BGW39_011091 [Mortierella sp. 14UC]|nr:hypothetical protein BGW39_011091 [Mortierella sp. 14UC]
MASHLYNLRDSEGAHHYNLRDSTASATKDQLLHSNPQHQQHHQQHAAHNQAPSAHAQGHGHGNQQQNHAQKSHTQKSHTQKSHTQKSDLASPVKLATGTEANLEHAVNPEHDPTHPGH